MNYLWWLFESAISEENCDRIIEGCLQYPLVNSTVGYGDGDGESEESPESIRRSKLRWIDKQDDFGREIATTIMDYVSTANRRAFGFDIDRCWDIQFTEYNAEYQGFYKMHTDNNFMNTTPYDRKLSIVIQLTDPKEYEGGRLQFANADQPENFLKRGSIIVFPSYLEHGVTPVTNGTRYSLVSWVEGPKFR